MFILRVCCLSLIQLLDVKVNAQLVAYYGTADTQAKMLSFQPSHPTKNWVNQQTNVHDWLNDFQENKCVTGNVTVYSPNGAPEYWKTDRLMTMMITFINGAVRRKVISDKTEEKIPKQTG